MAESAVHRRDGMAATSMRLLLALLSGGAAAIHFAAVGPHVVEYVPFAIFFVVVAVFQAAWSPAVLAKPSTRLLGSGAVVNAVVVAIWITSRTAGLPVGPHTGVPEPAGFIDVLATAFECVIVAVAFALVRRHAFAGGALGLGAVVAVLAVGVANSGAGMHDHGHFHHAASASVAHHLLHLLVIGGAAVIFYLCVVADVVKNGWPSFSWRVRPTRGRHHPQGELPAASRPINGS
jgi:hypothetical protein